MSNKKSIPKYQSHWQSIVHQNDNTSILRPMIILPIKRDFIAEALRKHSAEAISLDNRTSDLRKKDYKEADYKHQQYQKAKDALKRAEGFENLMKLTSPSTYVEAVAGLQLTPGGRLATDALVFGIGGAAKSLLTRGGSKAVLGLIRGINGKVPLTPAEWTAALDAAIARGDIVEALRLRDLHFKVNAPNNSMYSTLYHGSPVDFNEFKITEPIDPIFHTATLKSISEKFGNVKSFYGRTVLPLRISDLGIVWHPTNIANELGISVKNRRYPLETYERKQLYELNNKDSFREEANREFMEKELGGDSYVYNNEVEGGGDSYAFPTSRQLKLADAVTYDDKGIRIPLGERDNFNINDIRFFSAQPVTRANPVHTMEGNPLATRLARLREHTLYGFTPETNLGLMITPLLRVNNVRSFAKQIDPSLTDDLLDLIVQIAYANGLGVHIPIGNNAGATTGGLSIVDIQDAINYLKLSGIKNITSNDIGIIAGHEAGHGVQISEAAKRAIEGFPEPDEFYTRAGQVLDAAGIKSTANKRILFNLFMNMLDDYLNKGNLDNGVSTIRDYLRNASNVLKRRLIMKHINELSAVSGTAYLLGNKQ